VSGAQFRHVVFDADCRVCRAFRRWAKARDSDSRLAFVPNTDPGLGELGRGVDADRAARSLAVVMPDGRVLWGAQAVFATVAALPWPWRPLGAVMSVAPFHWLAEPIYWLFARNRGRFARFVRQS